MSKKNADQKPEEGDNEGNNNSEDELEKIASQPLDRSKKKDKNDQTPKKRRYSFSHLPTKKNSDQKKRRKSAIFKAKDFEYPIKPKEEVQKVTKSAESLLYESLHRLATIYPHQIRDISDFVFQEIIGHGGFGEVWLANDLRTGKIVAIKELFAEKLVGRNLTNFVREIVTMGKCKDRFIIPFIGYTVEKPYCIITEYMPNGALSSYLRKEFRAKPIFSGTHLTMIAMGLIFAIRHVHIQKIIHRDIKAANLLLDHHFLPKLCDFGISRFIKRKIMTDAIGTASHMAPEIMVSTKYDIKVDVFAYGATLFEMVEKKNPFAGHPMKEVINNIRTGKRPIFRRQDTPECLINLIGRCWAQNPKQRPTSDEIYKEFATGKAYFAGTDHKVIEQFAEKLTKEFNEMKYTKSPSKGKTNPWEAEVIRHLEEKMIRANKLDEMKLAFGLTISEDFEEDVAPRVKNDSEEMAKTRSEENLKEFEDQHAMKAEIAEKHEEPKKETTVFDVLADPNHPLFKEKVIEVLDKVTFDEFPPVYGILVKYFMNKDDDSLAVFILEEFTKLIQRDVKIIKFMDQYHFFSVLPVNSEKAQRATLFFIAATFEMAPNRIQSTIFRALGAMFRVFPYQTISLYPHFISRYSRIRDPAPALDFMLRFARNFVHAESGDIYIKCIYKLTQIEEFAKTRMEILKQTISAFTRSKNSFVMSAALNIFALTYKEGDQVPFDAIIRGLPNAHCADPCATILLKTPEFPLSKTLFKNLSEKCARPKIARCLMKFASMSKEHRKIALSTTKWMSIANQFTYKAFLLIFADPEMRNLIIKSKNFSLFLTKCLRQIPNEVLVSLGSVFRRMPIDQSLMYRLTEDDFFEALQEKMNVYAYDDQKMLGAFIILDACIQKGYSSDYKLFIDLLANCIENSNNLTKPAALLFVALSSHSKMAARFKKVDGLVSYFKELKEKNVIADAATVFLNNISSV
ncbi:TKL family protein kinase [Trichomonas vaginalis G3]|uniref:TKL family protein kinase n=1 Tax=Trichomonas vaginalis (strain ATCC PRA-98 / G3) TaxID=412133 RepID=A2FMY1_TRIV3|nr:protein kinase protein [Trichomonas vaginalis G3]EAX93749.1 TKL family protein kinase [Trichomonas vaginalis G3]KAI5533764.1 protein kinase protein [Trichomonas vaginalis G3]|eukprot:XP_001306679.1 TKL family protein kinase [Trichomonas vaginalis G3]